MQPQRNRCVRACMAGADDDHCSLVQDAITREGVSNILAARVRRSGMYVHMERSPGGNRS